jgi:hypothetical protein
MLDGHCEIFAVSIVTFFCPATAGVQLASHVDIRRQTCLDRPFEN